MTASTKNPIYTAYYSHLKGNCYKIDLPWSTYNRETIVLCLVSEGLEKAKKLAIEIINNHLMEALQNTDPESKF